MLEEWMLLQPTSVASCTRSMDSLAVSGYWHFIHFYKPLICKMSLGLTGGVGCSKWWPILTISFRNKCCYIIILRF